MKTDMSITLGMLVCLVACTPRQTIVGESRVLTVDGHLRAADDEESRASSLSGDSAERKRLHQQDAEFHRAQAAQLSREAEAACRDSSTIEEAATAATGLQLDDVQQLSGPSFVYSPRPDRAAPFRALRGVRFTVISAASAGVMLAAIRCRAAQARAFGRYDWDPTTVDGLKVDVHPGEGGTLVITVSSDSEDALRESLRRARALAYH